MKSYEELVSLLLDGEPTADDLAELEQILKENPERAEDLREQLIAWETWSQSVAPERSPEAFLAAFQTRLRAEADSTHFQQSAMRKLRPAWHPLQSPAFWAAAALIVILFSYFRFQPATTPIPDPNPVPAQSELFTVSGESVCTQCTLNQTSRHQKAIRYTGAAGAIQVLLLKQDPSLREHTPHFCGGPTPVQAEGNLVQHEGQEKLEIVSLSFPNATPNPMESTAP